MLPEGGPPWAGLLEIGSTWSDATRAGQALGTPLLPTPSPHPQPLSAGPERGRSDHRAPQVGARGRLGWGAVRVGGELGEETGDPPERAQPSRGLDAYKRRLVLSRDACAFSNIPTAALRGQLHPHGCTKPARVGYGGCCQAVGSTLFQTTPCYILNHRSPHPILSGHPHSIMHSPGDTDPVPFSNYPLLHTVHNLSIPAV